MEYRLYSFVNYYLSDIQKGIQTAHCVHDLYVKYFKNDKIMDSKAQILHDWAINDKTIIVLNGGNGKELLNMIEFIDNKNHNLPFEYFYEDEDSLCGALTSVAIVLPEHVYTYSSQIFGLSGEILEDFNESGNFLDHIVGKCIHFNDFEREMSQKLIKYRLA